MCVCAKSLQSCRAFCDPMGCGPPDSSAHGILQARTLELVACPPPGDCVDPGIKLAILTSPALADRFFTTSTSREAHEGRNSVFTHSIMSLPTIVSGIY